MAVGPQKYGLAMHQNYRGACLRICRSIRGLPACLLAIALMPNVFWTILTDQAVLLIEWLSFKKPIQKPCYNNVPSTSTSKIPLCPRRQKTELLDVQRLLDGYEASVRDIVTLIRKRLDMHYAETHADASRIGRNMVHNEICCSDCRDVRDWDPSEETFHERGNFANCTAPSFSPRISQEKPLACKPQHVATINVRLII